MIHRMISFRLPQDVIEAITARSRETSQSITAVVVELLRQVLALSSPSDERLSQKEQIKSRGRNGSAKHLEADSLTALFYHTSALVGYSPELLSTLRYASENIGGTLFVYKADADADFPCCLVIPDITPARLNKSPREIIGKGIGEIHPGLAERRRAAIFQSIASKEQIVYTSQFTWENQEWEFINSANYYPNQSGGGHVLVTVRDPDTPEGYRQRKYFYDLIQSGLATPTPRLAI